MESSQTAGQSLGMRKYRVPVFCCSPSQGGPKPTSGFLGVAIFGLPLRVPRACDFRHRDDTRSRSSCCSGWHRVPLWLGLWVSPHPVPSSPKPPASGKPGASYGECNPLSSHLLISSQHGAASVSSDVGAPCPHPYPGHTEPRPQVRPVAFIEAPVQRTFRYH